MELGSTTMLYLQCRGHTFYWKIDSEKLKCSVLTICASPTETWGPAPLTVTINLKAPYCVAAFGCGIFFVGKGQPVPT
ncbi:MAG TPA: hypothetical protein VLU95_03605 [Candidatus Acidoferrum sp.]|nr:hypothetical protein [Candidatus Acidoferrum sp.]